VGARVRGVDAVTRSDAIWVGIAQALALIPGTSRSGATITAGLFLGLKREAAARFSFLLSIPAIVLSGLYGLTELITGEDDVSFGALALATIVAFVFGYVSIAFLLRWLTSHSMMIFVVYRLVLGVIVLALAGAGTIS
jgi:undecaprenyl-diphosphatase